MLLLLSVYLFTRSFGASNPVMEVECEMYRADETTCRNAGCNWVVEEGEPSCEFEFELDEAGEAAAEAAEETAEYGAAQTGSFAVGVLEIECENYVADQAQCTAHGCNYSVDEGEPSCSFEFDPETETEAELEQEAEVDCEMYAGDQNACTQSGCTYTVDEEGEISCTFEADPETDAGELAEETAEDQAEMAEEGVVQGGAVQTEESVEAAEEIAENQAEMAEEGVVQGGAVQGGAVQGETGVQPGLEAEDVDPLEPGEIAEAIDPEDANVPTYVEPDVQPLRKAHLDPAKSAGKQTDISSWFLLGCTFLVSAILSVWCVTKTVQYLDRREYSIDLDTLNEDFNYESLA